MKSCSRFAPFEGQGGFLRKQIYATPIEFFLASLKNKLPRDRTLRRVSRRRNGRTGDRMCKCVNALEGYEYVARIIDMIYDASREKSGEETLYLSARKTKSQKKGTHSTLYLANGIEHRELRLYEAKR